MTKKWATAVVALVVLALAVAWFRTREPSAGTGASVAGGSASDPAAAVAAPSASGRALPHAVKDQAKRDELRRRLLAAAAEAEATAREEAAARARGQVPTRGQRETNDIQEFGRFVAQAIREDFIPMARECAKDLVARQPDAGGAALVAFELLGDAKIGGVVNDASVVAAESTIHDEAFETCVRESLYGVYFDPPPAGGRATLRFPITLTPDGGGAIDEQVEDFHLKDKR